MGKRGDKRRKKTKERRRRGAVPYEGFSYGPLTLERYGRYLRTSLDPEHPEFEAFQEAMRSEWEDAPRRSRELSEQIAELLAPYDAFDVLADLWMRNVPKDPDTYRESLADGLPAALRPSPRLLADGPPVPGNGDEPWIEPAVITRARELIEEMLHQKSLSVLHDSAEGRPDDFAQIRVTARLHRLAVRGTSYEWQESRTVRELFDADAVRDDVLPAAGFTGREALTLADAVVDLGLARFRTRGQEALAPPSTR